MTTKELSRTPPTPSAGGVLVSSGLRVAADRGFDADHAVASRAAALGLLGDLAVRIGVRVDIRGAVAVEIDAEVAAEELIDGLAMVELVLPALADGDHAAVVDDGLLARADGLAGVAAVERQRRRGGGGEGDDRDREGCEGALGNHGRTVRGGPIPVVSPRDESRSSYRTM